MPITRTFTFQEVCQVLAALRHWQVTFKQCTLPAIRVLFAEHFEDCYPVTMEEIDALCERINFEGTGNADNAEPDKREEFIRAIADMTKDGEGDPEDDAYEFQMTADDCFETLHSLISNARNLLGMPENRPGPKE